MGRDEGSSFEEASAVGAIDLEQLEKQGFPADLETEYRVVIESAAYQEIRDHAALDTSVELGGVLAGRLLRDDLGPFLLVRHAVRGAATKRSGSQVTFTHETWAKIHRDMEKRHPDLQIVGWYHTHPGFGIFLSEMDLFIQDHFFNLPHQVAFVYDPLADENGLFAWRAGTCSRLHRYWLAGRVHYDLRPHEQVPTTKVKREPDETPTPADEARARRMETDWERDRLRPATVDSSSKLLWLACTALFMLTAFWFGMQASRVVGADRQEVTRALESRISTGFFRDDLGRQLEGIRRDLGAAGTMLATLRLAEGPAAAGSGANDTLDRARHTVAGAQRRLAEISDAYTRADQLSRRMGQVVNASDELRRLSQEVQTRGLILATLCQLQAQALDPEGGAPSKVSADDLRRVAAGLLPPPAEDRGGLLGFFTRHRPDEGEGQGR